jgi:hypothetical protein
VILTRILITAVLSVAGLFVGGIIAAAIGVLTVGMESYDRAFKTHPMELPAVLSVGFYLACGIAAAALAWPVSGRWLKKFVAGQVTENHDTYSERGGARYPLRLGWSMHATWPFAQLSVTPQHLNLKVLKASFIFAKEDGLELGIFRQLFSRGLQIGDSRGQIFVFWSFDIEQLIARLRLFGYDI